MRTEGFLRFKDGRFARFIFGPVDLAIFEIVQVDLGDGRLLADEGLLGVFRPVVDRRDDDAVLERFLSGRREEAIDVFFRDTIIGVVKFTLDGVEFVSASGLGDEVDTGVFGDQSLELRPLGVRPDVAVEISVGRLVAEVGADKLFEVGAFFAFGLSSLAKVGEEAFQCGHVQKVVGKQSGRGKGRMS